MSGSPTHRHDELHRGQVPTGQLADGTASSGFVGVSNGDGTVTWTEQSGGGGACDHQHAVEEFTAAGDTPETFTLAAEPIEPVQVFVNGVLATPSEVTVTGSDVEVDTAADDTVVIFYAKACGGTATLTLVQAGDGSHDAIYSLVMEGWTGGTYALHYFDIAVFPADDYDVTGIPFDADASDIQGALYTGSYPGTPTPGDYFGVTGTGTTGDPFLIEFLNQYGLSAATLTLVSSVT